jgi:hypothetical protein
MAAWLANKQNLSAPLTLPALTQIPPLPAPAPDFRHGGRRWTIIVIIVAIIIGIGASGLERIGAWPLEIVKRSDAEQGFEVLPRRCVVERTFAYLNQNRRLAKELDATITGAEIWLYIATSGLSAAPLLRPFNAA